MSVPAIALKHPEARKVTNHCFPHRILNCWLGRLQPFQRRSRRYRQDISQRIQDGPLSTFQADRRTGHEHRSMSATRSQGLYNFQDTHGGKAANQSAPPHAKGQCRLSERTPRPVEFPACHEIRLTLVGSPSWMIARTIWR